MTLDNDDIQTINSLIQQAIIMHKHNGIDSTRIDFNNLTNSPAPIDGGANTVNGTFINLISAEAQGIGDAVQIDSSGHAHIAKADVIADSSTIFMASLTILNGTVGEYLVQGIVHFPSTKSWTVGGLVFLSTTGTTGNTLTQTAPSGTNNVIQILGVALAADTLFFNPCLVQVEHT